MLELNWVLKHIYRFEDQRVREVLSQFLGFQNLHLEASDAVGVALGLTEQSFSDALIHEVEKANGCALTATLDKKFARVDGVELL